MAVPTDIAGLRVWLKADAGTYQTAGGSAATADADPVGQWQDQSGNSSHAAQATAGARPALRTGVLGGLPVVRFDGVNDVMVAPITADASLTVFVLTRKNSAAQAASKSLLGWGSAASLLEDNDWAWYPSQSNTVVHFGGTVTDWVTLGLVFASNAACTPYLNGVAGTTFDPRNYDTETTLRVGGLGTGFLDCDIAEIIIYDSALGATDRQAIEAYLTNKWFGGGGGSAIAPIVQHLNRLRRAG